MRLSIHAHHLAVPADLPEFLEKHVTRPLARAFDGPAAELSVHLLDATPRRGGVDQECRLSFRIPGAGTLHVESTEDDLHKALLAAADRLKRLVRREVSKMRAPARKPVHRPLGRTWRERATRRGMTPAGDPSAL
ncbi:MAG TPA: HPF/RaiA family ribosome-associated protein [Anaeromyxobacter sp.]